MTRSGSATVISLSLGSVNVIDGCQQLLTCLLVYVRAQANVHQVCELLHGVLSVVLDELLHVILCKVVGLDVGLHKLFIRDGSQVGQLLQLHEELLEVELHQGPALITAFLHVSVTFYERPVGQADAVLPQDVGHRQRDAYMSGNVSQTLVELLKLL